jgi:hypothetical protein
MASAASASASAAAPPSSPSSPSSPALQITSKLPPRIWLWLSCFLSP